MKARVMQAIWNTMFVAGSGLAIAGIARWSHPAALLVGGLEVAAIGFLGGIDQVRNWRAHEEDEDNPESMNRSDF